MNLRRLISRMLAIVVIVGLVFAPLATPAAAKRLAAAEMTDMAAMPEAMPCCPDGQKSNNCRDCPLVAMCMLTIAQAEPAPTDGVQISFQTGRPLSPPDDLIADGLIGSPPDHPPRISI